MKTLALPSQILVLDQVPSMPHLVVVSGLLIIHHQSIHKLFYRYLDIADNMRSQGLTQPK